MPDTSTQPRHRAVNLLGAILLLLGAVFAGLGTGAPAYATPGVDDYPYKNSAIDAVDRWNFYTRECTSFVAWRINNELGINFTNQYGGAAWGNADHWAAAARAAGVGVDSNPTIGSVAYFPDNTEGAGPSGHVAWVLAVGSGTVRVEDYNWNPFAYSQHTVNTAGLSFIHFKNTTTTKLAPAVTVLGSNSSTCPGGTQYFSATDAYGVAINWTYANGSNACVRVAYVPRTTSAKCFFSLYVPAGHATATPVFGYWTTDGVKHYATLNENNFAGWTTVFTAANVTAINFQDNNGQAYPLEIGWGSSAGYGMAQSC